MGRRKMRAAAGVAAVALVVPAAALGSKTFFSATDGKALITFALKSGQKEKITDFSWDGLKCAGDRFAGGLEDPVKVHKDGSFESEQPVPGTDLEAKLKGTVSKDATKVNGKLKLTGDCINKVTFKARPSAG
jgi:hypothetical protein